MLEVLVNALLLQLEHQTPSLEDVLEPSHILELLQESQTGAFWKPEGSSGYVRPRTGVTSWDDPSHRRFQLSL